VISWFQSLLFRWVHNLYRYLSGLNNTSILGLSATAAAKVYAALTADPSGMGVLTYLQYPVTALAGMWGISGRAATTRTRLTHTRQHPIFVRKPLLLLLQRVLAHTLQHTFLQAS
jgi:hypothetical protein